MCANFLKDTDSLCNRIDTNSKLMLQLHLISSKFEHLIPETCSRQSSALIILLNLIPSKLWSAVLNNRYLEAFKPKAREQLRQKIVVCPFISHYMKLLGIFWIYFAFIDQNEALIGGNKSAKSSVSPYIIFVFKLTLSNPVIISFC